MFHSFLWPFVKNEVPVVLSSVLLCDHTVFVSRAYLLTVFYIATAQQRIKGSLTRQNTKIIDPLESNWIFDTIFSGIATGYNFLPANCVTYLFNNLFNVLHVHTVIYLHFRLNIYPLL